MCGRSCSATPCCSRSPRCCAATCRSGRSDRVQQECKKFMLYTDRPLCLALAHSRLLVEGSTATYCDLNSIQRWPKLYLPLLLLCAHGYSLGSKRRAHYLVRRNNCDPSISREVYRVKCEHVSN